MKKTLVVAVLGLAVVANLQAQSAIQLYNYGTPSAGSIVYTGLGTPITAAGGYTVGFYYALGDIAASVNAITGGATTVGGANIGTLVGSGVTLATGTGSTAALGPDGAGNYDSISSYVVPGAVGNQTVTIVLVAYNGSSYEASFVRGHSAAFTMTALASPAFPLLTGSFASGFAAGIPEPSTFALAGLGLAGLLIFCRRNDAGGV